VLIDSHPMGNEQTSYNTAEFVDGWKWVWSSIVGMSTYNSELKGRVFVDILNEPDSQGQRWEAHVGCLAGCGGACAA
jgi:hypothetical protein